MLIVIIPSKHSEQITFSKFKSSKVVFGEFYIKINAEKATFFNKSEDIYYIFVDFKLKMSTWESKISIKGVLVKKISFICKNFMTKITFWK